MRERPSISSQLIGVGMAWTIHPILWTDEDFVELSPRAQLLFLYLLTGARSNLPGLMKGSPELFAVQLRSRGHGWDAKEVRAALDELAKPRDGDRLPLAQYDPIGGLVRVPNAPRYNRADHGKHIIGWWRTWGDLPVSPLKYEHVRTLPQGVRLTTENLRSTWDSTFGPIVRVLTQDFADPEVTRDNLKAFESLCLSLGLDLRARLGSGSGSGEGSGSTGFRKPFESLSRPPEHPKDTRKSKNRRPRVKNHGSSRQESVGGGDQSLSGGRPRKTSESLSGARRGLYRDGRAVSTARSKLPPELE